MDYPQFWKDASPRRKRMYSTIFVFLLIVLATVFGVLVPPSPQEEQMIYDQLNGTLLQGTATHTLPLSIFQNNFLLCLAMFIPIFGLPIGLFIMFSSGQAFRAIFDLQVANGISSAAPPDIQASTAILVLVLAGAVFLLEYVSYTIGMTESIWLFRRITQHRWRELKTTAILIGIVALLLAIGAIVETWGVSLPL